MEDELIIKLYWNRSETAINETKKKYAPYLLTISNNILRNKQDAEECESDTYLHTWNSIPEEHPNNFKAYLSKIIRNISISRLRCNLAKKRGSDIIVSSYDELEECVPDNRVNDSVNLDILRESIDSFLENLPKEKRIIFMKRYWFSYSVAEIAKQMSRNEKYVTNILYGLRKKLRIHLERQEKYYESK